MLLDDTTKEPLRKIRCGRVGCRRLATHFGDFVGGLCTDHANGLNVEFGQEMAQLRLRGDGPLAGDVAARGQRSA